MLIAANPAVAVRRTTSWMCGVWPRFSWITITPGTLAVPAGRAMYARSDAPSGPFTSGLETVMRGSSGLTVTPSVVACAGGVAYGPTVGAGLLLAVATVGVAVPELAGVTGPHAATITAASAALPEMSVTLRNSSRLGINPS